MHLIHISMVIHLIGNDLEADLHVAGSTRALRDLRDSMATHPGLLGSGCLPGKLTQIDRIWSFLNGFGWILDGWKANDNARRSVESI